MLNRDPKTRSLLISVGIHVAIVLCFVFSFEKTKTLLPSQVFDPNKPIVEAVVINQKVVQKEIDRLAKVEKAKQREIERKEKEIVEKRQKEEALLLELKKKNEQLKKEAEEQRVAKIKREKEEKAEKVAKAKAEKLEKERQEKAEKEAKIKAIAEAKKKEAEQRETEMLAQTQANSRAINEYQALIRSILHQNWTKPTGFDLTGLACVVLVDLLPTGEVVRVTITRSSGNMTFDRSTEVAVYKSSPLPMPQDPGLAHEARQFEFKFIPEAV